MRNRKRPKWLPEDKWHDEMQGILSELNIASENLQTVRRIAMGIHSEVCPNDPTIEAEVFPSLSNEMFHIGSSAGRESSRISAIQKRLGHLFNSQLSVGAVEHAIAVALDLNRENKKTKRKQKREAKMKK